ncbi:MAG: T9SS type A sorting domain-containing protein [Bacteroidota bacterium]
MLLFLLPFFTISLHAQSLWTKISPPLSVVVQDARMMSGIDLYAISVDNFYRSSDAGMTWDSVALPIAGFDLFCLDMQRLFVVSRTGTFTKSTDGGMTWSTAVDIDPNDMDAGICHFASDQVGFFMKRWSPGIYSRTTDGGNTWTAATLSLGQHTSLCPSGDRTRRVMSWPTAQKGFYVAGDTLWQSTNAGATWNYLFSDPSENLEGIIMWDSLRGVLAGTGTFHTNDGGQSWTFFDTGFCADFDFPTPSTGYYTSCGPHTMTTFTGDFIKTNDSGTTRFSICAPTCTLFPYTTSFFNPCMTLLDFVSADTGMVIVGESDMGGDLYYTGDGAVNVEESLDLAEKWTVFPNPADEMVQVVFEEGLRGGRMAVVDLQGRIVWEKENVEVQPGARFPIHRDEWTSGLYFLVVEGEMGRGVKKVRFR